MLSPKASIKEQILFSRNMALMIKSGIPLLNSLKLLQDQTQSGGMKKILASVRKDVENGQLLSTSFKKFENGLGPLFINVIQVGESSGTLAENLALLGDELKKKQVLKSKVVNAMIYPAIIVVLSVGLISILLFIVFPKILPLFDSLRVALPLPTRMLIGASNFAQNNWISMLVGLMSVAIAAPLLMKVKKIRYAFQKLLLNLPVIGELFRSIQITIIARTLLVLLHSGIKIVDAILVTADISTNLVFESALRSTSAAVKSGEPLAKSLAKNNHLFPVMFTQMIEVSEAAGTLDTTLQYLNDYYETEVDDKLANFIALLEPLLLVVMGLGVAFMAISIIAPIYSLTNGISGGT